MNYTFLLHTTLLFLIQLTCSQTLSAATFVVNNASNTDDGQPYTSGDNTLRKCIRLANADAVLDNIEFNIAGPAIIPVAANTNLAITNPVNINGFTQLGASAATGTLMVQLNGITNGINILSLNAAASGSTIQGLVIYSSGTTASSTGILATGSSNNTFSGNHIGTNVTGTAMGGTIALQYGIFLNTASSNCIIGGTGGIATRNIISACASNPIRIRAGSNGTIIQGNYIGTDVTGNVKLANLGSGIDISASNIQTIGGTSYTARNIISGNTNGLSIAACTTLVIKGNFIGLGANGQSISSNSAIGITIITSSAITIGGTNPQERNVVSGNLGNGMQIQTSETLSIQNNYIGTDSTGLLTRGNTGHGISATTVNTVLIGGTSYRTRNVICNNNAGISLTACSTSVVIKGNFIGLGADGITGTDVALVSLGNKAQGMIINTSSPLTIGGLTRAERNVVSNNVNDGIRITASTINLDILNNCIGTDSTGILARGNLQLGVSINSTNNVTIGGSTYSARNIIANNSQTGLRFNACSTVVIKGNFIGLASNGSTAAGNLANGGILIQGVSAFYTIGGLTRQERNVIASNVGDAIQSNTTNDITIQNNYIGVDSTGLLPRGNTQGINLNTSNSILIGGTTYTARNIIANSTGSNGIRISACSTSVVIKGNFIGLAADGITAAGNRTNGIFTQTSIPIVISGLSPQERNVISSNQNHGIETSGSNGLTIVNTFIGVDSTGLLPRGNSATGMSINSTNNVTIGGSTYSARNIVSNNSQAGLRFNACSTVVIKGNFIGLAADGTTAAGNGAQGGIFVQNSVTVAAFYTIGGPLHAERNVISSNVGDGIQTNNMNTITIQNNYIGVDSTGLLARGNGQGINLITTNTITIGGTNYNLRNIIACSNNSNGIRIDRCSTIVIKGNFIGLAANGIKELDGVIIFGNRQSGINISGTTLMPSMDVTIGGPTHPERNLISSNGIDGIRSANTNNIIIQKNYIGIDSTGLLPRGNGQNGINLITTNNILIGGASYALRNVVAGSINNGIRIESCSTTVIKGNLIGLYSNGTTALGNKQNGILFTGNNTVRNTNVTIGGLTVQERNVIASNGTLSNGDGIQMNYANNVVIQNNYIGLDSTAMLNRGNHGNGISIANTLGVLVGGTTITARNIVCGSGRDGIIISDNVPAAVIKANFAGLAKDGVTSIPNNYSGLRIWANNNSSNGAIIGGSSYAERNVSSGNGIYNPNDNFTYSRDGIRIEGRNAGHIIKGNFFGVDSTGTLPVGNVWAGISLNGTKSVTVGGTGPFEKNICSANGHEGMYMRDDTACVVINNAIGTDITGNDPSGNLGNGNWGINFRGTNYANIIGGTQTNFRNFIANTKGIELGSGAGIYVDAPSQRNTITKNSIFCNAGLGIQLVPGANQNMVPPTINAFDPNSDIVGNGTDGDSIHLYYNSKTGAGCECEGEIFVGATIVAGGTWTLSHGYPLADITKMTATATNPSGSTSEFSSCAILPVKLLSFDAKKSTESSVLISWSTASERNNSHFILQRSKDNSTFEVIARIQGNGTQTGISNYSYTDEQPLPGTTYYKLIQVDLDGAASNEGVREVFMDVQDILILLSPNGIKILSTEDKRVTYGVYTELGQELLRHEVQLVSGVPQEITLTVSEGMYLFYVETNTGITWKKVPLHRP